MSFSSFTTQFFKLVGLISDHIILVFTRFPSSGVVDVFWLTDREKPAAISEASNDDAKKSENGEDTVDRSIHQFLIQFILFMVFGSISTAIFHSSIYLPSLNPSE